MKKFIKSSIVATVTPLVATCSVAQTKPIMQSDRLTSYITYLIKQRPEKYNLAIDRIDMLNKFHHTKKHYKGGIYKKIFPNGTVTIKGPSLSIFSPPYPTKKIAFQYAGKILTSTVFFFDTSKNNCVSMGRLEHDLGHFDRPYVAMGMPPREVRKKLTDWGWYAVTLQKTTKNNNAHIQCITSLSVVF